MPELPEVETVKTRLQQVLPGKTISQVEVLREKSFWGNRSRLLGKQITDVSRKAKLLRVHLHDNLNLLIHLKMTGQLIFIDDQQKIGGGHPTADWTCTLPSSHTRVVIKFSGGACEGAAKLFFNDMRVFGWIKVLNDQEVAQEYQRYGPDAIEPAFSAKYLHRQLKNRTIPIKQAIMLNEIVAGVGNIYAAEALFLAGIDPRKSANSFTQPKLSSLVREIKKVLSQGIEHGGTTFDGKYVDISGLAGSHQDFLLVYGREGKPCKTCGATLQKVKLGGRGTVFCPMCQK